MILGSHVQKEASEFTALTVHRTWRCRNGLLLQFISFGATVEVVLCERKTEIGKETTLYIWVTKTREARGLKVFWGGNEKIRKSVPPSSSLWARGQARGGRKGAKWRRRDEEGRERAGRICGDCRGAWNKCRII